MAATAPASMQVGVNCVVFGVVLARGLVNCGFIYYCHMRQGELYDTSHAIQFCMFIVFEDIVLMDSNRYRYLFRLTIIVFRITGISMTYSFPTISCQFRFQEKKLLSIVSDRFHPYMCF
jgi:xanthine/uracil permease